MRTFAAIIFALLCVQSSKAQSHITVASPDKRISFILDNGNGQLMYEVRFNNKLVIEPSALGITVNGTAYGIKTEVDKKPVLNTVNEFYASRGVHSTAINHYNAARIDLHSNGSPFAVETRVFNDGVAFRYLISSKDSSLIDQEATSFRIPASTVIWSQDNIKYYEGRYTKSVIDTMKTDALIGPPATLELPDHAGFAAITEGGLVDFAGLSLKVRANRTLVANLSGVTWKMGAIETPWRIIEIGRDLNTLVNSDIIADVSPAYDKKLFPKGYQTDWVKPGRGVWTWLAGRGPVTLSNLKKFTDFAAELGFEYNLVDEGWSNWKDSINDRDNWDLMKELVDYSSPKGVKIWVWKAYPDRRGIPGLKTQEARRAFFKKAKELGIVGLKIDFFDSEQQEIIDFYQAALKDAAEFGLMIDFHGANKPTGESRTFPNEMTREGIRGLENRPPWNPHNAILPFTRYLAGPADYTPVHFGNRLGETTHSYQIATAVIFTSPFLCYGADPQSILDHPAKDLIQSIPSTWDETIVLPQSKIGELVLYARRKGSTWFIAALNALNETRTVSIDLRFLKTKNYQVYFAKDDSAAQSSAKTGMETGATSAPLVLTLNPNGGYVGRFSKIN